MYGYDLGETHWTNHQMEDMETSQQALRRAVARSMLRRFHFADADLRLQMEYAAVPPPLGSGVPANDPERILRELLLREGITNFNAYASRMFFPAEGAQVAWANADMEGEYVANVLGRPLFVLDEVSDELTGTVHEFNLSIYATGHRTMVK